MPFVSTHTQPVSISKPETAKSAFTPLSPALRLMNGLHQPLFSAASAILLHNSSSGAQLEVINDACQQQGLNRSIGKSLRVILINDGYYYLLITRSN